MAKESISKAVRRYLESAGAIKFTVENLTPKFPEYTVIQIGNALQKLARDGIVYRIKKDPETRKILWATFIPPEGTIEKVKRASPKRKGKKRINYAMQRVLNVVNESRKPVTSNEIAHSIPQMSINTIRASLRNLWERGLIKRTDKNGNLHFYESKKITAPIINQQTVVEVQPTTSLVERITLLERKAAAYDQCKSELATAVQLLQEVIAQMP